uniref:Uncharacterized protein n=1 Tax=Rangifer tarandus platyrhynchus TaxID=3082113 RepID=A0ACB0FDS2_RANTA|nr:unnamed protein product [Rangifer tarandus platyrhynchus]
MQHPRTDFRGHVRTCKALAGRGLQPGRGTARGAAGRHQGTLSPDRGARRQGRAQAKVCRPRAPPRCRAARRGSQRLRRLSGLTGACGPLDEVRTTILPFRPHQEDARPGAHGAALGPSPGQAVTRKPARSASVSRGPGHDQCHWLMT